MCTSNYKLIVGTIDLGYNKILECFCSDKVGGFTKIEMVSPLYEKLPSLVLYICCTCNSFDLQWVRH